jgi:hypothetical protein
MNKIELNRNTFIDSLIYNINNSVKKKKKTNTTN